MKIAKLDHIDLHYRVDGNPNGRPVVFANSLGTDLRLWDAVLPLLPQGNCYIRYDKRGHGLSDCPPAPYSMGTLVRDVEALLDHHFIEYYDIFTFENLLFVNRTKYGNLSRCRKVEVSTFKHGPLSQNYGAVGQELREHPGGGLFGVGQYGCRNSGTSKTTIIFT